ncbi:MAG TPA: hypothetical protein PJ990_20665, partial [Saprospiraceae bacterium]|nr:hypothetical protein [Saprospiraceae bacterium]
MTNNLTFIFLAMILGLTISCNSSLSAQIEKPKISFTFDDGQTNDIGEYKLETWNQLLLDNLKKHNLKA